MEYNPYPLGKVPEQFQRQELNDLKDAGYIFNDAREVVGLFEDKVAAFAGSRYAIAVDCCSNGLFLCLKYMEYLNGHTDETITIPKNTYISVPMQVEHAGYQIKFEDIEWSGLYKLDPLDVYDGAVRWTKDMYVGHGFQVVSFQLKKRVPIGKGGMILTNDYHGAQWLKWATHDGRDLTKPYDDPDHIQTKGYHMYMTPEDAARGIILMDQIPQENEDSGNHTMYPDITEYNFYKE
jgi:dTDP-4-amino-4,6-dideoxygalactose transaminase